MQQNKGVQYNIFIVLNIQWKQIFRRLINKFHASKYIKNGLRLTKMELKRHQNTSIYKLYQI